MLLRAIHNEKETRAGAREYYYTIMGHRPPRLRSDLAGALVGALVGVVGVYLATFLNQTHWFLTHGFVPLGGP